MSNPHEEVNSIEEFQRQVCLILFDLPPHDYILFFEDLERLYNAKYESETAWVDVTRRLGIAMYNKILKTIIDLIDCYPGPSGITIKLKKSFRDRRIDELRLEEEERRERAKREEKVRIEREKEERVRLEEEERAKRAEEEERAKLDEAITEEANRAENLESSPGQALFESLHRQKESWETFDEAVGGFEGQDMQPLIAPSSDQLKATNPFFGDDSWNSETVEQRGDEPNPFLDDQWVPVEETANETSSAQAKQQEKKEMLNMLQISREKLLKALRRCQVKEPQEKSAEPKKFIRYTTKELLTMISAISDANSSKDTWHSSYITDTKFPVPPPKLLIDPQKFIDIRILQFSTPTLFTFQYELQKIKQLENDLKLHYDSVKNYQMVLLKEFEIGMIVVVKLNGKWCRAQIKQLDKQNAQVILIDQMIFPPKQIDINDIFYLHKSFANIPFKSAVGTFYGIKVKEDLDIKENTLYVGEIVSREGFASVNKITRESSVDDNVFHLTVFETMSVNKYLVGEVGVAEEDLA